MIKTITLKGKRVRCRAVKIGDMIKLGDVSAGGTPFECLVGEMVCAPNGVYRPLKRTRKKGKTGVKSVRAWMALSENGQIARGSFAYSWPANVSFKLIPVTITPGHAK